jgi:hypothetical protein
MSMLLITPLGKKLESRDLSLAGFAIIGLKA